MRGVWDTHPNNMIVITGAAGFIGSCLVTELNNRGREDLILVDEIANDQSGKSKNIDGKKYVKFYEKDDFLSQIKENRTDQDIAAILHMGACSSTTLDDAQYFKENNFQYTQYLAQWSLRQKVRFIYASSAATYGDGSFGYKDDEETTRKLKPLNLYGKSKQDFDIWALDNLIVDKMVGLKFFNVFGPNEYHKGEMRSLVAKSYEKATSEGKIKLFKSNTKEYKDGEQKRDFIYVKDAVAIVLFFLDNEDINGLFNVGTGAARSWNDLARAIFASVGRKETIEYFDMPENLNGKYQNFTQADISKLKKVGFRQPLTSLEDAVSDYVSYLKEGKVF